MTLVGLISSGEETRADGTILRWSSTEFVDELSLPLRLWCHDGSAPECRVYWGSHGCAFIRGHDGPHLCECAWEDEGLEECDAGTVYYDRESYLREVGRGGGYGWPTRYFGEDTGVRERVESICAEVRWALRSPRDWWRSTISHRLPYSWRPATCRVLGHRERSDGVCSRCWRQTSGDS